MVKHLTGLLTPQGEAADPQRSDESAVFDSVKEKFPLIIFSCVQLASKMSLHSHVSCLRLKDKFTQKLKVMARLLTAMKKTFLELHSKTVLQRSPKQLK